MVRLEIFPGFWHLVNIGLSTSGARLSPLQLFEEMGRQSVPPFCSDFGIFPHGFPEALKAEAQGKIRAV